LVALANECAHLEARDGSAAQRSAFPAQTKEQKDRSKLEWDLKSLNEQVVQKFEERKSQIETRYQQTLATVKANESNSRKRGAGRIRGPAAGRQAEVSAVGVAC